MSERTLVTPGGFTRLPSTRLGRISAWLFVGALALLVLGPLVLGPLVGSAEIGQLNVGPAIGVLVLLSALVTGAIALIKDHERSWVVWVAVVLPSIVLGAEIISMLIPGE